MERWRQMSQLCGRQFATKTSGNEEDRNFYLQMGIQDYVLDPGLT